MFVSQAGHHLLQHTFSEYPQAWVKYVKFQGLGLVSDTIRATDVVCGKSQVGPLVFKATHSRAGKLWFHVRADKP